jgi:hypothetical protein
MRTMSRVGRRATVLALVLGLSGCGATSHHVRSHTTSRPAHAAQPDRRIRHTATGSYAPLGPPQHGAGGGVEDDEPHASRSQVSDARSIARAFFSTYVAFLYGRVPARRVIGADPNLRRELEQGHATATPAERAARPRIEHLSLSPAGPPISVVALASVMIGCCSPLHLSATLEPHRGGWLVVAVDG